MTWTVHHGDCRAILPTLGKEWAHACITDAPYNLDSIRKRFSKVDPKADTDTSRRLRERKDGHARRAAGFALVEWDDEVALQAPTWRHVFEALKPGAFLLTCSAARKQDLMAGAIREAGFEIVDGIAWIYDSGQPASHAIDKAISAHQNLGGSSPRDIRRQRQGDEYHPTGQEDYKLGRNFGRIANDKRETPLTEDAQQFKGHASRMKPAFEPIIVAQKPRAGSLAKNALEHGCGGIDVSGGYHAANVIWDGSGIVRDLLGDAAKFFSIAKPEAHERPWHCSICQRSGWGNTRPRECCGEQVVAHSTMKPLALMRELIRRFCPADGTVLEPFAGSGTTIEACILEGRNVVGMEMTEKYIPDIEARIRRATTAPRQVALL